MQYHSPPRIRRNLFVVSCFAALFAGSLLPGPGQAASAEDGIAVPDGTPEELVKFIKTTRRKRVRTVTQLREKYEAVLEAAEKVLDAPKADDESQEYAIGAKFSALSLLGRYARNPTARLKLNKESRKLAESLKDDKRKPIRTLAQSTLIGLRAARVSALKAAEIESLMTDAVAFLKAADLKTLKTDTGRRFSAALGVARSLERSGKLKEAAVCYTKLAAVLKGDLHERLQGYSKKFEGAAKRVLLPGNPIVINGKTADGKPFDLKKYKGKVVLIDFWATWCGPCIAELPNVKKYYKLYHKKGFEIVGINMDTNRIKFEQFVEDREIPWVNLVGPKKEASGWDHPIAVQYGVMAIPTVMLVDQKGNVVSIHARGAELGKQLRKLLGPADLTAEESKKDDQ